MSQNRGAARARGLAHEEPAAPDAPAPDRAAQVLWAILAALTLARAALAFVPSMWAWGPNLLRFVPPVSGWVLWALAALALVPAFSRRVEPAMVGLLASTRSPGWLAYAPWVVGAAALVWCFPDRVLFVGDFTLREISIHTDRSTFETLYPQALPLDRFLHDTAVRAIMRLELDSNSVGRIFGAVEAGLLGGLAVRFARALDLRGAAALAATAVVLFGGYLALFTGYNKAFAEMVIVTVAVAAFGVNAVRRGRGLLALGVTLAAGLLLHRLALGLIPAVVTAWVLWLRRHGRDGAWQRPAVLTAAGLPILALAAMAPRLLLLVTGFDRGNFLSDEVRHQGGVIAAALSGVHLADLKNLALLLSPLAPVILLAPLLPRSERRAEWLVLVALIVPLVAFVPFYRPPQGLFRDWDGFAVTGAALSVAAAATVGGILRASARYAWLAVAVALGAAAPSAQWLIHHANVDQGIRRVEAFVDEAPRRSDLERATVWDYLGMRYLDLRQFDASAGAFARAAELTPSPRILRAWAASERVRGNREVAREIYRRLLERQPDNVAAWLEFASLSIELGDAAEARAAAESVLRRRPGHPAALAIIEALERGLPAP